MYQPTAPEPSRRRIPVSRDSDIAKRLVPGHLFESGRRAAQRRGDAIGVVLHLGERDALLAGETRRQRVVFVGAQRDEPAVLDGRDHAAQRLADPAERRLVLGHRRHPD